MAPLPDDLPDVPPTSRVCRLGDEDAAAVDRLLEGGGGGDAAPTDDREAAVQDLLRLLEEYPVEPASEELVHATLARVSRAEASKDQRLSIQNAFQVRGRRIRVPDFFAIAAALLFAVGIGWPLLQSLESGHRRLQSQHRLGTVGQAIAGFGGDSGGWLPFDEQVMTPDEQGQLPCGLGGHWSSHLHQLAAQERLLAGHLYVGDSPEACTSLISYRVAFQLPRYRLDAYRPTEALAADPNPLIEHLRRHERPGGVAAGAFTQQGSGVVVLLFDLSTPFQRTALMNDGDSLWVHRNYDESLGDDQSFRPADLEDDVLSH